MAVEVTSLTPLGPWALTYLWPVLRALLPVPQGLELFQRFTVHSAGGPEAAAVAAATQDWLAEGFKEFRILQCVPNQESKVRNVAESKRILAESVTTPYALFVDADVLMPRRSVRTMLAYLKRFKDVGAVGIPYTMGIDHVQGGCILYRTDVLQKVRWTVDRCDCRAAIKDVEAAGHRVVHLGGYEARHLSRERGMPVRRERGR